jgi:hypothetical protein
MLVSPRREGREDERTKERLKMMTAAIPPPLKKWQKKFQFQFNVV